MSSVSAREGIKNLIAYLIQGWIVILISLGAYALLRPWLIENTANYRAIFAIWLLTTVGVLYVVSKQF